MGNVPRLAALAAAVLVGAVLVMGSEESMRRLRVVETPEDLATLYADAQGIVTYDPTSGRFYYPSLGLYLNPVTSMFYDPSTGAYRDYALRGEYSYCCMDDLYYDAVSGRYFDAARRMSFDSSTGLYQLDGRNFVWDSQFNMLYDPGSETHYDRGLETDLSYDASLEMFYDKKARQYYDPALGLYYDEGMGMFFDPICGRYYDRDAQMYYDPNTGKASLDADGAFYFDPTENAYYNEKDGCWYCHDDETGLYIDQTSSCDMGMMMMVMGWGPRYYDPETEFHFIYNGSNYVVEETGDLYDPGSQCYFDLYNWTSYRYDSETGGFVDAMSDMSYTPYWLEWGYYAWKTEDDDSAQGNVDLSTMTFCDWMGMYYDSSTLLYYDAVDGMYYDGMFYYRRPHGDSYWYDSMGECYVNNSTGERYVPSRSADLSRMTYDSMMDLYHDDSTGLYYDAKIGLYTDFMCYYRQPHGDCYYFDSIQNAYVCYSSGDVYYPHGQIGAIGGAYDQLTEEQLAEIQATFMALDYLAELPSAVETMTETRTEMGAYTAAPFGFEDALWFKELMEQGMSYCEKRIRLRRGVMPNTLEVSWAYADQWTMPGYEDYNMSGMVVPVSEALWNRAERTVVFTLNAGWNSFYSMDALSIEHGGGGMGCYDAMGCYVMDAMGEDILANLSESDRAVYNRYAGDWEMLSFLANASYGGAWAISTMYGNVDLMSGGGATVGGLMDTDGDGLSDLDEIRHGTNPFVCDTDGDGMNDALEIRIGSCPTMCDPDSDYDGMADVWEEYFGFNPSNAVDANADPDHDGLNNQRECWLGTNPRSADTDGDGLRDGDELKHGTQPCNPDTDNDQLPDGAEVARGTNPCNPDTDNDQLPDGAEVARGTNPCNPDTDGDGLGDGDECFNFNTDPCNAYSAMEGIQGCSDTPWMAHAFKDSLAVKFGGHSPFEVLADGRNVYEHAIHTGTWNGPLTDDAVVGNGDVVVTLGIDKSVNLDASTLHVGELDIPLCPGVETRLRIAIPAYLRAPIWHERDTDDYYDYYQFLDGIVTFEDSTAFLMKGVDSWAAYLGEVPEFLKAVEFPTRPVCVHGIDTRTLRVEFPEGPYNDERAGLIGYTCTWTALYPDGFAPCTDLSVVDRTDHRGSSECLKIDLALDFPPDQVRRLRLEYVPVTEYMETYEYLAGPRSADIEVHCCPRPEWLCDCAGHMREGTSWRPWWISPCPCNALVDPADWDGDGLPNAADPDPRGYTHAGVYDSLTRLVDWQLWDERTRFGDGAASGLVYERTFVVWRTSAWQQFFLSSQAGAASGWTLPAGMTLEWEDSGGATGSAVASPVGDSLRLQLSKTAATVTFRLRAVAGFSSTSMASLPSLHLLGYVPDVVVSGQNIVEDEEPWRGVDVFAGGLDAGVPIRIDRSARPCFSPLAAEESDVAALVEDDFERDRLSRLGGGEPCGPICYVKDSGGAVETGTLYVPQTGIYQMPGDGLYDMQYKSCHFLVLDPSVVFGPDACSDAGRIVWDAETDTHSPALDWPLDTACLRRAWRSDADGGWDELPEPMVDPGVDTNEYDFVDATLELADDGESCTGRVHVFGEEVWSGTAERRRRPCRGFDLADPFADGCGCCSGGCADGDCDALERPTVLDSSLCFRIPGGSPRKGQVSNFLSFAAPDPSSVSLGPALFKLTARPDASVEDATEGTVRTVACSDDRGRDVALESIPDGVRATVRDHATQRLEHTWEITRPNGSGSRIRFHRISRLDNTMDDLTFAYDWDTGSWTREDAVSGASETTEVAGGLDDPLAGNALVETKTTVGADGVPLVRTVVERTRLGSRRNAVLRETRRAEYGWDAAAETWHLASERLADYYDDPGAASFGKVRLVHGTGMPWTYRVYDAAGREALRAEQRDGTPVSGIALDPHGGADGFGWRDSTSSAFVTVLDYAPHSGDADAEGDADLPRTESRFAVAGLSSVLVARTWRRYTHPTVNGYAAVKCETWRAASRDAAFGDAGNAYSYAVAYDESAPGVPLVLRGETAEALDEDGIRTVRTSTVSGNTVTTTERKYKGVSEFPTYAVEARDATHGTLLRRAEYVRATAVEGGNDTDDVVVDREVNIYDEKNRLRSTTYLDGSVATNHYSCCRLLDRTDREGRKTLRSAVTGQDKLYYAEEDVYLGEISSGGGHRATQHFFDVLGRETNTTTYVETTPGAAVDKAASNGHEAAVRETFYPRGTDDLVVRVDERGKTTTAETAGTQAGTTTTETVSTNGVVVTTTTTTSLRSGATTTRTAWDGGWTETRAEEDYGADGCRVVRQYRSASDMQEFLAETSVYDFLGRLVSSSRPGMNNGTVTTTTAYDGVSSRRVSSSTTGSPAVSYAYDQLGELATTTRDGVTQTVATSYEWDADDDELYKVERTWRTIPSMFVDSVRTRETRTRLTELSNVVGGLLSRRVLIGEDGRETVEERGFIEYEYVWDSSHVRTVQWTEDETPEVSFSKYGVPLLVESVDKREEMDYDAMGQVEFVWRYDELDTDSYSSFEYDCAGTVVGRFEIASQSSDAGHLAMTSDYDELGNETVRRTALSYNPGGRPPVEHAVTNSYDALERTVLVDGSTYPVGTSYDAEGRKTASRTTRNDGDSWDETTWTYDRRSGLNTAKQYADGSSVTRTYTDEGRPVRTTWARGSWRENAYDTRGLLSGVSHSSPATTPDVAFTHNAAGLVATASCGTMVSTAYTYDSHLNCTEEASTVDGQSFTLSRTFDEFIRPSSVSVSNGGTAYAAKTRTYDSENRVSGYTLGGDGISNNGISVSVSYAGHLPVGMTYTFPNGNVMTLALTREPGRATWIKRRDYAFNNTTLYWHRTDYDAEGRPTETEDSLTATRQWLYNRRSELTSMTEDTAHPRYSYFFCDYAYDSAGNRTFADGGVIPPSVDYTANSLNQYASIQWTVYGMSNAFQPVYDADGNLVQDDRFTYAYDDENRLVSVSVRESSLFYGARAVENAYDHRSRRIRKVVKAYDGEAWQITETHTFVWDGWNIVFEQIDYPSAPSRHVEYFWGNDVSGTEEGAGGVGGLLATRIDGVFTVPVYGGNGNIVMYVDQTGRVVAQYDYDPYGGVLTPLYLNGESWDHTLWNFGFSTKYRDWETDLVPYQLRTYDPLHGRWLNRDPIEEEGGENLYTFCLNKVTFAYDSLGRFAIYVDDSAIGHVGLRVAGGTAFDYGRYHGTYSGLGVTFPGPNVLKTNSWDSVSRSREYKVFEFDVCQILDDGIRVAAQSRFNGGMAQWPDEEKFTSLKNLKANERYMGSDWSWNADNCMTFTFRTIVAGVKEAQKKGRLPPKAQKQAKLLLWLAFDSAWQLRPASVGALLDRYSNSSDWISRAR